MTYLRSLSHSLTFRNKSVYLFSNAHEILFLNSAQTGDADILALFDICFMLRYFVEIVIKNLIFFFQVMWYL